MNYPDGIDLYWLGVDGEGFVAALSTGGCGPIPMSIACQGDLAYDAFERAFDDLPKIGDAQTLIATNSDHKMLAEKGFYAFDWTDVHRVAAAEIHAYELFAAPAHPITVAQLPLGLAEILKDAHIKPVTFRTSTRLPVSRYLTCAVGRRR
jgi:hypothetical protein